MIMKNISSVLGPLSDLAKLLGANQSLVQYLSEAPKGVSYMEEIQRVSESAQKGISLLLPAMIVSVVLAIIGLVMVVAGYRIIKRQP